MKILLSLALIVCTISLTAQSTIYGVSGNNLVSYDYRSGQYDTVTTGNVFPENGFEFSCTIDPFNGRYYYNTVNGMVYIDLNTLESGSSCSFNFSGLMEYNCLNNSLITDDLEGNFYSCDLTTSTLTRLSVLPSSTGYIFGETRVYNPVRNEYFFERYNNDTIWYDLINGLTGALISSIPMPHISIESPVVDYNTGNYYGIFRDTVFLFEPSTGYRSAIVKVPIPMDHLNFQMAVFDQDSSKYIVPTYKNSNDKAYYMVIDINRKLVERVMLQPNMYMNWQRIYTQPPPILLHSGDSLICTKGKSYYWTCDNIPLSETSSNCIKPTRNGTYRVNILFPNYTGVTNEVALTGISESQVALSVDIHPNPVSRELTINLGEAVGEARQFRISDARGKQIEEFSSPGSKLVLNVEAYPAGIYFIRIESKGLVATRKFCKI